MNIVAYATLLLNSCTVQSLNFLYAPACKLSAPKARLQYAYPGVHNLAESTSNTELLDLGTTELELECFMEELLLCISLEDELTDELDLSLLLLEDSPDFTELELLESDESFVSFAELLDLVSLLDDFSFSIFSLLDPFDSADAPLRVTLESGDSTDELETPVSSELADEESSQAERAKNAANKKMVMSRPFGKLRDLGAMQFFIKHPRL